MFTNIDVYKMLLRILFPAVHTGAPHTWRVHKEPAEKYGPTSKHEVQDLGHIFYIQPFLPRRFNLLGTHLTIDTMNVIMLGQHGVDHGHHHGWTMDALFYLW